MPTPPTRNRIFLLVGLLGLLVGVGGTVVYLGWMWHLSPADLPDMRFNISERDLWQRKADWLPTITAPVGFALAATAAWPWLNRRKRLHWAAWPLLLVVTGFGVTFAFVYFDILTSVPCHEEDDDCGPGNAWRIAHPAFYLLPIALTLVVGLWRRRRTSKQDVLAAGVTAVIGLMCALLAYAAATTWVPPVANDMQGDPFTSIPATSAPHNPLAERLTR
jgi:hypothetical protein